MSSFPTIEIGIPGNKTRVPRIGLGAMGMSSVYGAADDEQSVEVLNHAIDIGCTFWDTADIYGTGHNEKLLSQVLKDCRKDIFLCTKFGITFKQPEPGFKGDFTQLMTGFDGSPDYVRKCINESLARLGTDYIDLYYQLRMDPNTPIEETVQALAELVKEGKIRYIGLSECSPDELRRAHRIHPITAVQVEYSPWSIHIETNGILDICRELGITVVAYSPLGHGIMTGSIRSFDNLKDHDWRRTYSRFKPGHLEQNLKLVDALSEMASKQNCTSGQLALAWLLAQENNMIVIPGTKQVNYLNENFHAGKVKLGDNEIKALRKLVDNADICGGRY